MVAKRQTVKKSRIKRGRIRKKPLPPKNDVIRLTAVIAETTGDPSAILRVNDRSKTVERGDSFMGKREKFIVTLIGNGKVVVESATKKIILSILEKNRVISKTDR